MGARAVLSGFDRMFSASNQGSVAPPVGGPASFPVAR